MLHFVSSVVKDCELELGLTQRLRLMCLLTSIGVSLNVPFSHLQVTVADPKQVLVSKTSLPRIVFPTELLPDPVFPTSNKRHCGSVKNQSRKQIKQNIVKQHFNTHKDFYSIEKCFIKIT